MMDSFLEIDFKKKHLYIGIASLLVLVLLLSSIKVIGAGEIGIVTRLGDVNRVADSGLMFRIPFIEKVIKMDTRIQKEEVKASAVTQDLQDVDASLALNYSINKETALKLYKEVGTTYTENIINPILQESFKAGTAKYTAEGLITNRSEAKESILQVVKGRLNGYGVVVADLNIVNLDFSEAFNQAIEEKAIAQQQVEKAKQELEREKIEAEKKITAAKADAEAQRLQQETLSELMIKKMWIEKWQGEMPQVVSGDSGVLLNLGDI